MSVLCSFSVQIQNFDSRKCKHCRVQLLAGWPDIRNIGHREESAFCLICTRE